MGQLYALPILSQEGCLKPNKGRLSLAATTNLGLLWNTVLSNTNAPFYVLNCSLPPGYFTNIKKSNELTFLKTNMGRNKVNLYLFFLPSPPLLPSPKFTLKTLCTHSVSTSLPPPPPPYTSLAPSFTVEVETPFAE